MLSVEPNEREAVAMAYHEMAADTCSCMRIAALLPGDAPGLEARRRGLHTGASRDCPGHIAWHYCQFAGDSLQAGLVLTRSPAAGREPLAASPHHHGARQHVPQSVRGRQHTICLHNDPHVPQVCHACYKLLPWQHKLELECLMLDFVGVLYVSVVIPP